MLLVIDIGNTNLSIGIFSGDSLVFTSRLATDARRTSDQYALELHYSAQLKNIDIKQVKGAVISSVVPEATNAVKEAVRLLTGTVPLVLGPGVKSGINIRIDNPAQLGADFVAGAAAAVDMFELPCLLMDLGTATKISIIDEEGSFRGCTISPGVGISVNALSSKAALLPGLSLSVQDCPAFGTNTISSMQAGIIRGTAAMLDGLCDGIEEALGQKIKCFAATGGHGENIVKYCRHEVVYEPDLLLYGLKKIYEKNV